MWLKKCTLDWSLIILRLLTEKERFSSRESCKAVHLQETYSTVLMAADHAQSVNDVKVREKIFTCNFR